MIDLSRWLPGLADDDELDPVTKTLRALGQVPEALGDIGRSAGQSVVGAVQGAAQTVQDAYAVPTEERPPAYSGPSYAQPSLAPGQPSMLEQLPEVGQAGLSPATETLGDRGALLSGLRRPETALEVAEQAAPAPARAVQIASETGAAFGSGALRRFAEGTVRPDEDVNAPLFTTPEVPTPLGTIPAYPVTRGDVGAAVGTVLGDPTTYLGFGAAGRAADAPVDAAMRAAGRGIRSSVGAAGRVVGGALDANAARTAEASARMAAEGSTTAPGVFGALPEPSGARRGLPTVEAISEQLSAARDARSRAVLTGDAVTEAAANDHMRSLEEALADAVNARRELEPRIRSDVGRQVNPLALTEESADDLTDAMRPREAVRGGPDELSGPVGIPVDMAGRMNASAGAAPSIPGTGVLPAVNRALSEGIAGGVGGAFIEQGRNPDEDPRTAVARGFAAGAVGFPIATRAARGAARLAGAAPSPGGGALATLGTPGAGGAAVPPGFFARFPGAQKAIAASQARAANMAARGITAPSGWEWAKQAGYSGIFGPATATGQLIGGALDTALAQPKEAIRALTMRQRGRYGKQARAQLAAVPEAWEGLTTILTGKGGPSGAQAVSGGAQGATKLSERVVNPVAHLAARALERPGEILAEAPDTVFRPLFNAQGMQREADTIAHEMGMTGQKAASYSDTLMQSAQTLRANPTTRSTSAEAQRVVAAGKAYADEMGYKGDPGGIADWIGKQAARDDAIGFAASFLMPFSKTPGNIALATARSTPGLGLLPSVRKGRPVKSFDVIYDQAFGTVAASGLAAYALNGGITGTGPDNKAERDAMIAQGWQPRSFLVGGHYVPNRMLGKWGPILDTIGEAHDHMAYRKADAKPGAWVTDAVKRIGHIATDQVGLSGLADIMDLIDNAGSGGAGFVGRNITRYMPYGGIIRAAAQSVDTNARKPETTAQVGFSEATRQQVEQSIPGLRGDVPAAQDVLGRDAPNPQQGLGAIIPKTTTVRDDPTIRLFTDAEMTIGPPHEQITVGKVSGMPLTPAEQRRWNTLRGQVLVENADAFLSNADFMGLEPKLKQRYLQKYLDQAASAADKLLLSEMDADDLTRRATDTATKKAS